VEGTEKTDRRTWWTRSARRQVARRAGRAKDEPLTEADWGALLEASGTPAARAVHWILRSLPHGPRCGSCGAPFAGVGARLVRPLGYRPSQKNPYICAICVESSPPGGFRGRIGVLFADLRGFTAASEGRDPRETSRLLERFYACAEDVFFPEAIIDKLIGDEVMAIYLPHVVGAASATNAPEICTVMVDHARELLGAVGYGSSAEPFAPLGIGADYGDAYVGNVGDRALYDFTAVGGAPARLPDQRMTRILRAAAIRIAVRIG
jgi:adenylate cyclase